jgi:hypothetical protein
MRKVEDRPSGRTPPLSHKAAGLREREAASCSSTAPENLAALTRASANGNTSAALRRRGLWRAERKVGRWSS